MSISTLEQHADYRAVVDHYEFEKPPEYLLVDDIPEAHAERLVVRQAAESLLESRRQHSQEAGYIYESVDALSTAHTVLASERQYGCNSEPYQEKWSGLLLDCERLVGEWYRKNTAEYFEPVRQVFDADKAEFFSHGLSIQQMTENALVPIAEDAEEEARRVNERVEEATPHILRSLGSLALGKGIVTISQCTDSAITSYQSDLREGIKHRGYRGYVPEIEKVMIRHIALDTESSDRFETQIGLPGTYLSHEVFQIALTEKGVDVGTLDKTALHGAQLLVDEDPMEFVKHLDTVATAQWCTNIFMGEAVPDDHPKDYEAFRIEAHERKEMLAGYAETVALFVLDLAKENYDRKKAPEHVENFVKTMLLNLAKKDSSVAEQMFDSRTAQGLRDVAVLEAQGRFAEANELWRAVEQEAPGGGSCGAGSCGLEGVSAGTQEDKDLRKRLGASESDTLVKDKERPCRCGSKSIVYAYNERKVIKYCESCKAFEKTFSKAA
jgi:hypothetical protein